METTRHESTRWMRGVRQSAIRNPQSEISSRSGFTLVELLVVITIIGILAGLITVAAVGALKSARQTEIKTEINQIDTGFMDYKSKSVAFPPNCQTDGPGANNPLNEAQILTDLKRHVSQIATRSQEPDDLLRVIAGINPLDSGSFSKILDGGMTAGEAVVFWLGGFSEDPKYPISGEGGPSYRIDNLPGSVSPNDADPIESRSWVFPFEVTRLAPRSDQNYFNDSKRRYVEYRITINGEQQRRRINFWQYTPRKSQQPYLYFDTSRHPPTEEFDPPAATDPSGVELHVHALKKQAASAATAAATGLPIQFVDPEKFQVLHCGLDEAWDVEAFERMSYHAVKNELGLPPDKLESYLVFPSGPFIGEIADTIVNFATETKLEDAQP